MTITFDERFRQDIPDTTKVSGIYIDRANSNWRNPSSYVVAFNVKGLGTIPYRVPVAEAMLVAKSRIKDFDNVSVTISGRASPVIERNKTITGLLGLKAQFQRKNSNGVHEYRKSKTISAKGCDIHI
tara:strand:+ start:1068 stop:1448 length:381 start_codon:yes stop_codon:yes gene_type:complete